MINCDNCSNSADYTHAEPGVNAVNYCASCLPSWLLSRAQAGEFPLVTKLVDDTPPADDKPAAKRKKAADTPAPVDTPVDTPVDAPANATAADAPTVEAPADASN